MDKEYKDYIKVTNPKESLDLENTSPKNSEFKNIEYKDILKNISKGTSFNEQVFVGNTGVGESSYDYDIPLQSIDNLDAIRAERQKWYHEAGAFVNQAVLGEIVGGTIEGTGYLLDLQEILGKQEGTEDEFRNWFSDLGKDLKEFTRSSTPIYQKNPGEFNPTDSAWWFGNGVSVASTLSLMIPASGATRGLGALGKLLGVSSKLGKGTKFAAQGITAATLSRHMENMMESGQVFETVLEEQLAQGIPEEEAMLSAGEAASSVYRNNWALLAMDIPQYLALGAKFKPIAKSESAAVKNAVAQQMGKGITPAYISRGLAIGGGFASEGFEEGYQHVVSEEARYDSEVAAGLTEETNFGDRLNEYLRDGEFWTAVTFGGLGGGVFQSGIGKTINKTINKVRGKENPEEKNIQTVVKDISNWGAQISARTKQIKEADATGNPVNMFTARREANLETVIGKIKMGTLLEHKEYLEQMANMSEEEIEAFNTENPTTPLDKDVIKDFIPQLIEDITTIENIYNSVSKEFDPKLAGAITAERFRLDTYSKELETTRNEITEYKAKVPNTSKLSGDGHALFEIESALQGAIEKKKLVSQVLKSGLPSNESVAYYESVLENTKKQEKILKNAKEKILKDSTRTAKEQELDSNILKGVKSIRELSKAEAKESFLEDQINRINDRLNLFQKKDFVEYQAEVEKRKNITSETIDKALGRANADSVITLAGMKGDLEKNTTTGEYTFTPEDNTKEPFTITYDMLDMLYVESAKEQEKRTAELQAQEDLNLRRETIDKLLKDTDKRIKKALESAIAKENDINTLMAQIWYIQESLDNPNIDSLGRKYYLNSQNKRISKEKLKLKLEELKSTVEILEKEKNSLEEQALLMEEEVLYLNNLKAKYRIGEEDVSTQIDADYDRWRNLLASTEIAIQELNNELLRLNNYITVLEDTIKNDDAIKDFIKKYPKAPHEYSIKEINAFFEANPNFTKLKPKYLADLRKLDENKRFLQDELFIAKEDLDKISNLIKEKEIFSDRLWTALDTIGRIKGDVNSTLQAEKEALQRQKEKLSKQDWTSTSKGDNLEPTPLEVKPQDKLYEEEFQKTYINSTAGAQYIKDGDEWIPNPDQSQVRWFKAMSTLPNVVEGNYFLEIVTSNRMPEAFTEEELTYERENNYKGLKVVLVDKDGKYIRTDDKGRIGKGDLLLSTSIHAPSYVDNLSDNQLIIKYMADILGKIVDQAPTKSVNIKGKEYSREELLDLAKSKYSRDQENLREEAFAVIERGERPFLNIIDKSAGIPNRVIEDGERPIYPMKRFANNNEISSIQVATSNRITTSNGAKEVVPGAVYVEDKDGRVIDAVNRTLNDKEVKMVADMLHYFSNVARVGVKEDLVLTNEDKTSTVKTFNIVSTKEGDYGLIPTLIHFGKISGEKDKKYEIYLSENRRTLHFGGKTMKSADILNADGSINSELEEFLKNKYHQVRNSLLGRKEGYLHPISFNPETRTVKVISYKKGSDSEIGGYEKFLLDKGIIGTDLVSNKEEQFESVYLIFDNKVKTRKFEEKKPITRKSISNDSDQRQYDPNSSLGDIPGVTKTTSTQESSAKEIEDLFQIFNLGIDSYFNIQFTRENINWTVNFKVGGTPESKSFNVISVLENGEESSNKDMVNLGDMLTNAVKNNPITGVNILNSLSSKAFRGSLQPQKQETKGVDRISKLLKEKYAGGLESVHVVFKGKDIKQKAKESKVADAFNKVEPSSLEPFLPKDFVESKLFQFIKERAEVFHKANLKITDLDLSQKELEKIIHYEYINTHGEIMTVMKNAVEEFMSDIEIKSLGRISSAEELSKATKVKEVTNETTVDDLDFNSIGEVDPEVEAELLAEKDKNSNKSSKKICKTKK